METQADGASGIKAPYEAWAGRKMKSCWSLPVTAPYDAIMTFKGTLRSSPLAMCVAYITCEQDSDADQRSGREQKNTASGRAGSGARVLWLN